MNNEFVLYSKLIIFKIEFVNFFVIQVDLHPNPPPPIRAQVNLSRVQGRYESSNTRPTLLHYHFKIHTTCYKLMDPDLFRLEVDHI